MADFDLILRDGLVGDSRLDVGVQDGIIIATGSDLSGSADVEISISGKSLYPGFIDAHVHFNEPGRADWEGFETGSRALAAGGGTVFCDMPLNSTPPVVDAEAFSRKREIGEAKSLLDFGLWGGMIPGNSDQMPRFAELGAVGAKAFMADSGLEEFPRVTPRDLKQGMQAAAEAGLLVAVHAESQELLEQLDNSRPIEVEVEAIRIACDLAGETGCPLHIVHVSSAEGIEQVKLAKTAGVDVTAETCPHYLFLSEEDFDELGAIAKCAPPLRKLCDMESLTDCLLAGEIDTIGSDHSPSLPEMKSGNIDQAWGGISGCQHAFSLFVSKYPDHIDLLCKNPADRMGLSNRKGAIEPGRDADFAIVDFSGSHTVRGDDLLYKHAISPYVGRQIDCVVEMTFSRGRLVHRVSEHLPTTNTKSSCSQFLARQEPT